MHMQQSKCDYEAIMLIYNDRCLFLLYTLNPFMNKVTAQVKNNSFQSKKIISHKPLHINSL